MNINEALWILERAHTRDDELTGYVVQMQPDLFGDIGRTEYIEAWGVLRRTLRHGDGACNVCGERLSIGCCNPNRQSRR